MALCFFFLTLLSDFFASSIMDISSLIDSPKPKRSQTGDFSPQSMSSSRRQTVSSLLNDEEPLSSRNNSISSAVSSTSGQADSNRSHFNSTMQDERAVPPKRKRYTTVPIYARSWLRARPSGHLGGSSVADARPAPTNRPRPPPASSRVSGLPVSLNGVTPFEDLTRKVTEWLYSHLFQLGEERRYVEVELKLGTLNDKSTEKRLDLPVITETIIRPDFARQRSSFTSSMTDELFSRANTFLDSLVEGPSKAEGVAKTMTKTRDAIFESNQGTGKIRFSYNETGNLIEKISKTRISDMMIYSPGDLLDIRISISLETPISEEEPRQSSLMVRNKNRQSYTQDGLQIDLTAVISNQQTKNHSNRAQTSKELEIEFDSRRLLEYFTSFQDQSDAQAMDKFEELVKLGLDNTRLIARKLSR